MSVLNNKFIGALVVLNLAILLAVVWLVGALTGFKINQSSTEATVTAVMQKQGLITEVAESAENTLDDPVPGHAISTEISPTQPRINTASQVEIIEDSAPAPQAPSDEIIRRNEIDAQGNLHILISNALQGTDSLNVDDTTYLASLDSLTEVEPVPETPVISKQAAVLQEIHKRSQRNSVDHYNKIKIKPTSQPSISLADQIQGLVDQAIEAQPAKNQNSYLKSLEKASQERINESRTITVHSGDTLWTLAVRAYGDGFQYPKIFNANPHLLSPDQIEVGEILRVPQ